MRVQFDRSDHKKRLPDHQSANSLFLREPFLAAKLNMIEILMIKLVFFN